jgi:nitrogen fixation protein NifU and related proteins
MNALRELYQEIILDHYRRPRNFGPLEGATHQAAGHNPLCGDQVKVYLDLDGGGAIGRIGFEGAGCAISTASASLMTEAVAGLPVDDARRLFQRFHDLLTHKGEPDGELGDLEALAGVRDLPVRIKCATLPWHTLKAALDGGASGAGGAVSTEKA